MPRWRSSGAASIEAKSRAAVPVPFSDSTFVIAAVRVVFPWSMCPIVPTLRCGFVRSNFCFAISPPVLLFTVRRDDLGGDRLRHFLVTIELHRERRPALRVRAEVRRVA